MPSHGETRLCELQEAHRPEAVRVCRKVLAGCPGLGVDADDVVQEVNLRYLLALRAGGARVLERAFGDWVDGRGAPTPYYWESLRNAARNRVAASQVRRKHERRAADAVLARPAGARLRHLGPQERARVPALLAEAYTWVRVHEGDWAAVALLAASTETEVRRRVGWAVAHRDDRCGVLTRDAGLEPGWLRRHAGKVRAVALCLLERSAWPQDLWISETGLGWDALQRARQRARLLWPRHSSVSPQAGRTPDSCRPGASTPVEEDGGRDPSARS